MNNSISELENEINQRLNKSAKKLKGINSALNFIESRMQSGEIPTSSTTYQFLEEQQDLILQQKANLELIKVELRRLLIKNLSGQYGIAENSLREIVNLHCKIGDAKRLNQKEKIANLEKELKKLCAKHGLNSTESLFLKLLNPEIDITKICHKKYYVDGSQRNFRKQMEEFNLNTREAGFIIYARALNMLLDLYQTNIDKDIKKILKNLKLRHKKATLAMAERLDCKMFIAVLKSLRGSKYINKRLYHDMLAFSPMLTIQFNEIFEFGVNIESSTLPILNGLSISERFRVLNILFKTERLTKEEFESIMNAKLNEILREANVLKLKQTLVEINYTLNLIAEYGTNEYNALRNNLSVFNNEIRSNLSRQNVEVSTVEPVQFSQPQDRLSIPNISVTTDYVIDFQEKLLEHQFEIKNQDIAKPDFAAIFNNTESNAQGVVNIKTIANTQTNTQQLLITANTSTEPKQHDANVLAFANSLIVYATANPNAKITIDTGSQEDIKLVMDYLERNNCSGIITNREIASLRSQ